MHSAPVGYNGTEGALKPIGVRQATAGNARAVGVMSLFYYRRRWRVGLVFATSMLGERTSHDGRQCSSGERFGRASDTDSVRDYGAVWNRHDMVALANLFADDAHWIMHWPGKSAVMTAMSGFIAPSFRQWTSNLPTEKFGRLRRM
jgi:hypothetical protein